MKFLLALLLVFLMVASPAQAGMSKTAEVDYILKHECEPIAFHIFLEEVFYKCGGGERKWLNVLVPFPGPDAILSLGKLNNAVP